MGKVAITRHVRFVRPAHVARFHCHDFVVGPYPLYFLHVYGMLCLFLYVLCALVCSVCLVWFARPHANAYMQHACAPECKSGPSSRAARGPFTKALPLHLPVINQASWGLLHLRF